LSVDAHVAYAAAMGAGRDASGGDGASSTCRTFGDVRLTTDDDCVATVEIARPPNNFMDFELIRSLADAYETADADPRCRAIVLCSDGKHFCAGVDFTTAPRDAGGPAALYDQAVRLFRAATPVVAAVQGAAVGGGLGLACSADFRVASPESRFSANFARLGFHHGFGLSITLPAIVGRQRALDLLYTGRRVPGTEAAGFGLCDRLVDADRVRVTAHALAAEVAASAPLAVRSIRATMRADVVQRIEAAMKHEAAEQDRLRLTGDWLEGVRATAERRPPRFEGR
jgi:enoyl-CoA hydratase/carnithine racemase